MKNASQSDPGAYALGALVKVELSLPATHDCYSFLLVDSYGNGLYSGSYVTFYEKETGRQIYSKEYNYYIPFDEEEVLIEVDPTTVSIQPISTLEELVVYPNPVDGELHMTFAATHPMPLTVSLHNLMGETILALPEVISSSGVFNYTIDLRDLAAGVYTLNVVSGNEFWTRKIVVTQ